ncbi:M48 family metallopeptidase [Lactobacillus sp. PV037]|uniref:M48 family metallopeptidase n=1 Tax=unclassified Lactobacillus TaxID=2620435 RepID=UPI002240761C|nr:MULTISPECIES: M48 family metallopeptidase [unclassified Lactobacillus]QNQ82269.1 M48 family metallopeptidase [Lactobacillus sp. PV012]QNQ83620.1 M48 family metallopeptidase [Lactobacillus sp. PV037]
MLYKQIEQNKRNTWIMLGIFLVLLLAISVLIGCLLPILGVIFFIFSIGYVAWNYFRATNTLLKVTGAQEVTRKSNPQIYEMVEELCLAAGMPMPKIYISPTKEVNAFSTGFDPEHASLVLYQGLLDIMNRDEVRGVIGHELAHIRNYDIRITVLSSILVNFILWTGLGTLLGGWTLVTSDGKGWGTYLIKGFGLLILGFGAIVSIFAIPIAKLLSLLISRQREYLADAGSADLTREPSGLISGLQKLEDLENGKKLPQNEKTNNNLVLQSLYFNAGSITKWYQRLFSDHPPLDKRIERLKNSAKI